MCARDLTLFYNVHVVGRANKPDRNSVCITFHEIYKKAKANIIPKLYMVSKEGRWLF